MKILREISDRVTLIQELQPDQYHPSYWHLVEAIFCSLHCFEVEIDHETAANLLINSSPRNLGLDGPVFVKAEQAVMEILAEPSFLQTTHPKGGLNGTQVSNYVEWLTQNPARPQGIVFVDFPEGLYVRDGMHRLIAYHGGFHAEDFPLIGYYCRG
jgi:hypothetical protein